MIDWVETVDVRFISVVRQTLGINAYIDVILNGVNNNIFRVSTSMSVQIGAQYFCEAIVYM